MLFAPIGKAGQQLLADSGVLLVGCGALGCVLADSLTRAGVGRIRIVDRDFVEVSNLQRQVLFTESDAEAHLPKAVAAKTRLQQINSSIQIEAIVADVTEANILKLVDGVDLILDGTDNFEIRYLINDVALETSTPWVFTGCTGSVGQMMPVIPAKTGCLRCLMPEAPPTGSTETCDTAGVLGPAVVAIASLQAAMAIRILIELPRYETEPELVQSIQHLTMLDAWDQSSRQMDVRSLPDGTCPACCEGERRWLRGQQSGQSTVLCGRNAVQVTPASAMNVPLADIAKRFQPFAEVMSNQFLVRATMRDEDIEITVFPDGRAIIKGTEDPSRARSIFARWIGS
ncbi:UNVERIFIED_CONTAM: hypothetical protein GTU68_027754 [Idotea baltica]|nr:hypothetical protein [Idotea baltica]MCL4110363.1 hypothetical protein [Idotea baltica]